eukprot:scpid109083/ scgid19667/ 
MILSSSAIQLVLVQIRSSGHHNLARSKRDGASFSLPRHTHLKSRSRDEIQAYEYVTALYQRSLVLCCSAVFSLFRLSSTMPASVFDFKVFILYFQGAVAVIIVISSPAVHGQRFYP